MPSGTQSAATRTAPPGVLRLQVIQARVTDGDDDPCHVLYSIEMDGMQLFESHLQPGRTDFAFSQVHDLVTDEFTAESIVMIHLWERPSEQSHADADVHLGVALVPLSQLVAAPFHDQWYPLADADNQLAGQLRLACAFTQG